MAGAVDIRLYEELAKRDPKDVVFAPFCDYLAGEECYRVAAWGGQYLIYPHAARIATVVESTGDHPYFGIFLINYLLGKKESLPLGEWISVKDFPGGVTFFRGPHEVPTRQITELYGNDGEALEKKCEELGGKRLDFADYSYSFTIIGGVCAALLYWQGDEDFGPEATILLDKSTAGLALDVVFALLCEICARIRGQ